MPRQSIEDQGGRSDKGLSFTSLHFGNSSLVKNQSANKLDIKVSHAKGSPTNLTNAGKSLDHKVINLFATHRSMPQRMTFVFQLFVGKFLNFRFERINFEDNWLDEFHVSLGRVKKLSK